MNPKVSVIIPTYNCARYIGEAVESVLNQTYKDFEIIVVDDGSIDNTKDVLASYIEKGLIRYIYQKNQGPGAARNTGIKATTGEFVAFLDADDLWRPEMLKECVDKLENGNYDWVVTDFCILEKDKKGGEYIEVCRRIKEALITDSIDKSLFAVLIKAALEQKKIGLGGPSKVVVSRRVFSKVGFFDESLRIFEDQDFWLRVAEAKVPLGMVPLPLHLHFVRENSLTQSSPKRVSLDCQFRFIEKWKAKAFAMDKNLKKIYAEVLWNIARLSFYDPGKRDWSFIIKCAIKSIGCQFCLKRIIQSTTSLVHKRRLSDNEGKIWR